MAMPSYRPILSSERNRPFSRFASKFYFALVGVTEFTGFTHDNPHVHRITSIPRNPRSDVGLAATASEDGDKY